MDLSAQILSPYLVFLPFLLIFCTALLFWLRKRNTSPDPSKVTSVLESGVDDDEIDYEELQKSLSEGVQALDNVRANVHTLFSGVQCAQDLHEEVENCVSSLVYEVDTSVSLESTVKDLEKMLENEVRNRWAMVVAKDHELKAIDSKCAAFETAIGSSRQKYESELEIQKEAFDKIVREKEDEIKIREDISMEQKRQVSDLQAQLEAQSVRIQILETERANQQILEATISESEVETTKLKSETVELRNTISQTSSELAEKKTEIEELKSTQGANEVAIQDLSVKLLDANQAIEVLEASIKESQEKQDQLRALNQEAELNCSQGKLTILELESECCRLKEALNATESFRSEISELKEELSGQSIQFETFKKQLVASVEETQELREQLTGFQSQQDLLEQIDFMKSQNKTIAAESKALNEQLDVSEIRTLDLEAQLTIANHDLKKRIEDLAQRDAALQEALHQSEQFRNEQKLLIDKKLEIATIEADERIRDIIMTHDHHDSEQRTKHLSEVDGLSCSHKSEVLNLLAAHQDQVACLNRELGHANIITSGLSEEIDALNIKVTELEQSLAAAHNDNAQLKISTEEALLGYEQKLVQMELNHDVEKDKLTESNQKLKESVQMWESEIESLKADLEKAQQACELLVSELETAKSENLKSRAHLDELDQIKQSLEKSLLENKAKCEKLQEGNEDAAAAQQAVLLKVTSEFEDRVSILTTDYENQLKELRESTFSQDQAAEIERREKAFAETLRESLAAVTKAKDAELAAIQADFLSKSVEKEAELEKARLDFQSKLTAANKMFEQQSKNFDERLKAELDAQASCSATRFEFAEHTISNLQEELQSCRARINELNAQVKISKFKADGAGVLLDRVHTYKTQLVLSDQERAGLFNENLQLVNALEDSHNEANDLCIYLQVGIEDLNKLNHQVDKHERTIRELEGLARSYQSQLLNITRCFNASQMSYDLKISHLGQSSSHVTEAEPDKVECLEKKVSELASRLSANEADYFKQLHDQQLSNEENILRISTLFEEKKARAIDANQKEAAHLLNSKQTEIESLIHTHNEEIKELKQAKDDELSRLTCTFNIENMSLMTAHEHSLLQLNADHEYAMKQLLNSTKAEQTILFEKAKTEATSEWHEVVKRIESSSEVKVKNAIEATQLSMQRENQFAIQDAIEKERELALKRLQIVLEELQQENDLRLDDAEMEFQSQLGLKNTIIEELKATIETQQQSQAAKPKSSVDPISGSRPTPGVIASNKATRRDREAKENVANNNANIRNGHQGPDSLKTVSSRSGGGRSRSRRDSLGNRYWKASDFSFRSELAKSSLGTIYLAVEHKTMTQYVIKKISRKKIEKLDKADQLIKRIEMMGQLSHDNVRRMLGSFEDDRWVYIVLEYIPNAKPLNNRLRDLLSNKFVFPPSDVAFLVSRLSQALEYVHSKGMIHCQVSAHKVLLTSSGDPKLAAPNIGIHGLPVPPPEYIKGTPSQTALTPAVDSWGLGVLAFTLLVGRAPFTVGDDVVDLNLVAKGEPAFSSQSDPLAKSLIEALLVKDPRKRMSMHEIASHPFILHYLPKDPLPSIQESEPGQY